MVDKNTKIPYVYIRGAELGLLGSSGDEVLVADDSVHQVITTLRGHVAARPLEALSIIDALAVRFGELDVDSEIVAAVTRTCGFLPPAEGNARQ